MVDLWGRAGVAFHVTEEEEEANVAPEQGNRGEE